MTYDRFITLAAVLGLAGCASWFMNGGKLLDKGAEVTVKASFTAPACTLANGSPTPGPAGIEFQLAQSGPDLGVFERGADGSGALITNHWADDKADHYFGWVQSSGWEYVIPKEPGGQAERLVYVGLEKQEVGTATKPTSAVSARCPLVPAHS